MKYIVKPSTKFQKYLKRIGKRGYDLSLIAAAIKILASGEDLPAKYKDHNLSGVYAGYNECHITPDWLLIYSLSVSDMILYLTRTGTHSDLF